jgi:hypothetical protein
LSQQAQGTSRKLPFPCEAPQLFGFFAIILHYITIIAVIFSIICIIRKQKVTFRVGIHYRLHANCIIHHGGTLLVASGSGVDSIGYHQDYFSHNRAGIGRAVLWVRTTDV